jgi:hypothetical protein
MPFKGTLNGSLTHTITVAPQGALPNSICGLPRLTRQAMFPGGGGASRCDGSRPVFYLVQVAVPDGRELTVYGWAA